MFDTSNIKLNSPHTCRLIVLMITTSIIGSTLAPTTYLADDFFGIKEYVGITLPPFLNAILTVFLILFFWRVCETLIRIFTNKDKD